MSGSQIQLTILKHKQWRLWRKCETKSLPPSTPQAYQDHSTGRRVLVDRCSQEESWSLLQSSHCQPDTSARSRTARSGAGGRWWSKFQAVTTWWGRWSVAEEGQAGCRASTSQHSSNQMFGNTAWQLRNWSPERQKLVRLTWPVPSLRLAGCPLRILWCTPGKVRTSVVDRTQTRLQTSCYQLCCQPRFLWLFSRVAWWSSVFRRPTCASLSVVVLPCKY